MDEFNSGDTVLIAGYEELVEILNRFSPTLECIKPLTVIGIADHYATILDIVNPPKTSPNVEDFAVLILEEGQDLVLPLTAFRKINIQIDELEESMPKMIPISKKHPSILSQELNIVQIAAAECIQSAYRRYQACKQEIKKRRKLSSEKLVLNMAAETITKNLRRVVSKTKSLRSLDRHQGSVASNSVKSNSSLFPDESSQVIPIESASNMLAAEGIVLSISNIFVQDLANVAWNENNNLYILIEHQSWLYKREVLYSAGKKGNWKGHVVNLNLNSAAVSPRTLATSHIKLYVYHSCWAIQDKLIGFCEVPTSLFNPTTPLFENSDYSAVLYDSTSIIKRKMRGSLSFQWSFVKGTQSIANLSPRVKEEGSRLSTFDRLDASSVVTKYIDLVDIHQNVNGLSPSQLVDAADLLKTWERGNNAGKANAKSNVPKIPVDMVPQAPAVTLVSNLNDKTPQTRMKKRNPINDTTAPSSFQMTPSPVSTARMSNITEDNNNRLKGIQPLSGGRGKTDLVSPRKNDVSAKRISSAKNEKELPFTIDHQIDYVFDQAFYFSLLKMSSHFSFSLKEFIILLDSLDIPINEPYVTLIQSDQPISARSSSSRSAEEKMNEVLHFPINHPTSFAATMIDLLQNRYPMIIVPDLSLSTLFTPQKVIQCLNNLIDLLKINYFNIRGMIFLACCGKELFHQSSSTKIRNKSSIDATNNTTQRPSQFNSGITKSILQSIKNLPPSKGSHQNYDPIILESLNGKGFLQLSSKDFSNIFGVRSSLLLTRIKLYQSTLNILDSCWDRGIRPQDKPLAFSKQPTIIATTTNSHHPTTSSSPSVFQQPTYQQIMKTLSRQMINKTKSFDSSSINTLGNPFHQNSNNNNQQSVHNEDNFTAASSSNTVTQSNNKNHFYLIQDHQQVLNQYLSLNRAYGWNYPISLLTIIANQVSGCYCYKLLATDRMTSHELADLYGNKSKNKNQVIRSASIESTSLANCPELVWISLLFMNDQLYDDCAQILLSTSREYSSADYSESSIPPVYHLIECVPNNKEIFIHLPISCLKSVTNTAASKHHQKENHKMTSAQLYTEKLQELYQLFYSLNYNTIPMEDVSVGMIARIVSYPVLHRITSSKYEWWDRPSQEMLQKMANKRCEIISINELYSEKRRVGIKLLNTNICEALPYEALLPCADNDADSVRLHDGETAAAAAVAATAADLKSNFIRRTVSQGDPNAEKTTAKKKKNKRRKSIKNTLNEAISKEKEEEIKRDDNETTMNEKKANYKEVDNLLDSAPKKSLRSESLDVAMMTRKSQNPSNPDKKKANSRPDGAKAEIQAVATESKANQQNPADDLFGPVRRGDESFLPTEVDDDENHAPEDKKTHPFTIEVETKTKSGRKTKEQSNATKFHSTAYHPNVLNIELRTEKDYSWLSAPKKNDFHLEFEAEEKKKKEEGGEGLLVLENLDEEEEQEGPAKSPRASSPIGKMHQAELDFDHAIYTHGVLKYGAPPPPKDPIPNPATRRPKSATVVSLNRKKSDSPTASPNQQNRRGNNQKESTANSQPVGDNINRPKTASALNINFELAGLGYDTEGRLRESLDQEEIESRPLPDPSPILASKVPLKYHTNRVIKNTYKYYENQAKEDLSDLKHLQSHLGASGNTIPLTTFNPWDNQPPAESSPERLTDPETKKQNKKQPIVNALKKEDETEKQVDAEEDAKPVAFDVKVKKGAAGKSLKEALLYEREKIRTQKEIDKKENYLLKELKKLGIDVSQIK